MIDNTLLIDGGVLDAIVDCEDQGYSLSHLLILFNGRYYVKLFNLCILAEVFSKCGYDFLAERLYDYEELNCHE